jgi:hypothetical protein
MYKSAALALMALAALLAPSLRAASSDHSLVLQHVAASDTANNDDAEEDDSPEVKFNRRFPQNVKVGHLIGLPVLDDNDVTLGHVQKVVRTPDEKIQLIVSYSKWFGWFGRPVAVPIEVVALLALQIDSVDMQPDEYAEAPTWTQGKEQILADSDTIRIALGRR